MPRQRILSCYFRGLSKNFLKPARFSPECHSGVHLWRYGGPTQKCPRTIPLSISCDYFAGLTDSFWKPISLSVLLQRRICVVDWSRRLPTLTICKRSSLWCVDCPMLPWQPATRCWLFAGRNAWSQITFFVRLNLSTDLTSQVRNLKINAHQNYSLLH